MCYLFSSIERYQYLKKTFFSYQTSFNLLLFFCFIALLVIWHTFYNFFFFKMHKKTIEVSFMFCFVFKMWNSTKSNIRHIKCIRKKYLQTLNNADNHKKKQSFSDDYLNVNTVEKPRKIKNRTRKLIEKWKEK